MSAQVDLYDTLDRTSILIGDAVCLLRAARTGRLCAPHRHLLTAAVRKLEWAQDDLFKARNDPWTPPPRQNEQLALV